MGATQPVPVVIVGAGQAAAWVASTLAELSPGHPIVMIGDEELPPYERPPLSKGILAGLEAPESALIRPVAFWVEAGVELRLGLRVMTINRDRREVALSDGSRVGYGALVLATGCRARPLPAPVGQGAPVLPLRTMTDAAALRERLVPGTRIVAVGAGFIGLEVAATARSLGCEVTVVEKAAHAMSRVIDPVVAERLVALHIEQGVRFVWGQGVDQVAAKAGGARVRLEDGSELEADVVVAGVGASPNTALAEAAGLPCDNGILVDEFGRTADPAIFAAGDVTRHYNPVLGRWLRLESWQNAQNQGISVGRTLAGRGEPYAEIPWFWSDQYGANFQMIGAPTAWDRVIVREGAQPSKFTAVYLQDNRVVAGKTLNNARDIRFLRQMIQMERPVDAALLADPAQPLSAIVKLQETI